MIPRFAPLRAVKSRTRLLLVLFLTLVFSVYFVRTRMLRASSVPFHAHDGDNRVFFIYQIPTKMAQNDEEPGEFERAELAAGKAGRVL